MSPICDIILFSFPVSLLVTHWHIYWAWKNLVSHMVLFTAVPIVLVLFLTIKYVYNTKLFFNFHKMDFRRILHCQRWLDEIPCTHRHAENPQELSRTYRVVEFQNIRSKISKDFYKGALLKESEIARKSNLSENLTQSKGCKLLEKCLLICFEQIEILIN